MTIDDETATSPEASNAPDVDQLVTLIRSMGGRVSPRTLARRLSTIRTVTKATAALQSLADAGAGRWVVLLPGRKGGRPSMVFELDAEPGA